MWMLSPVSVIRIKAEFFSFVMSLSKDEITTLIRKRRKKTLYETIAFLQSQVYDEDLYFTDPRNASVINRFNISRQWPHHQYIYMRPKDVPDRVYRSWYAHFLKQTPYHEWSWHARDHEWLLSNLLE